MRKLYIGLWYIDIKIIFSNRNIDQVNKKEYNTFILTETIKREDKIQELLNCKFNI